LRQLRELISFVSQFSFLKWDRPRLYLEVSSKTEAHEIEQALSPIRNPRLDDAGKEILQLGEGFETMLGAITIKTIESIDQEFTEGSKTRVTHLRTERSAELKRLYFDETDKPEVCDMCSMDTPGQYPWTEHVIELHHLLPLSSPVRVEKGTTS